MKVCVKYEFIDLEENGVLRKIGSTFKCSEERYKQIKESGDYVYIIENKGKNKKG